MKIADTNNHLKFIENTSHKHQHHHLLQQQLHKRSLIPITTNKIDNSKQANLNLEKLEVKNLPKSGLSRVSINTIELDNTKPTRISHYETKSMNSNNAKSNLKRFETYHVKNTTGVKYLSQIKKTPSQLVNKSKPLIEVADLKSQTILINKAKQTSVSHLSTNKTPNTEHESSRHSSLISSSGLSSGSINSLSSETSIINKIEETKNVFDLVNSIKLYLKKIEANYSVDNLFSFLKASVRSSEIKITIDYLEQFKQIDSMVENAKNSTSNNTNSLPTSQLSVNYPVPIRSISQLKPSVQQNIYNRKLLNSTKPIKKLFKHLNLFRSLYHIMQRDLIVNVFLLELPKMTSNDLNKLSTAAFLSSTDLNNETIKASNQADLIHRAKLSITRKLRYYHEKIYNLNETLSILINDTKTSDLKLLSKQSTLPLKYDYFKHGEFVLRYTIDIVKKFRLILNMCQKAFYLHQKLSESSFDTFLRLNQILDETEEEDDDDTLTKLDHEIKRDTTILKSIQRKKPNMHQKLPTINNNANNNSNNIKTLNNNQVVALDNKPKSALNERERIIHSLTKQDSVDSFIRETDTSSLLSENDDSVTYYPLNDPSTDLNEESTNLKNKVSSMNSIDNPDSLLEEYRIYKQKLDMSQSTLRNLNFYMENLLQRVDRYNYLEMQLKNDNELIKRTEMSLKQYQIDNMFEINGSNVNGNNNNLVYVTKNSLAINLAFRKQLERQLDFLKYRFKLNLQDFNVEKVCIPEINYAIMDTEKKIANLTFYVNDLNKYLNYIESKLSEQFLSVHLRQQQKQHLHNQHPQYQQQTQLKKPVSLARHSSNPTKNHNLK